MNKQIVLTRDMVPIHISGSMTHSCNFVCPLPKNYKIVIQKYPQETFDLIMYFVDKINEMAESQKFPFVNILYEYYDRTKMEQDNLLKQFRLQKRLTFFDNERGLTGTWAGGDINSGDIYLSCEDVSLSSDISVRGLKDYFEPGIAFFCHNIDFYWQALLTRELCIWYYNLLCVCMDENYKIVNKGQQNLERIVKVITDKDFVRKEIEEKLNSTIKRCVIL